VVDEDCLVRPPRERPPAFDEPADEAYYTDRERQRSRHPQGDLASPVTRRAPAAEQQHDKERDVKFGEVSRDKVGGPVEPLGPSGQRDRKCNGASIDGASEGEWHLVNGIMWP
jgi:hypothetical protein